MTIPIFMKCSESTRKIIVDPEMMSEGYLRSLLRDKFPSVPAALAETATFVTTDPGSGVRFEVQEAEDLVPNQVLCVEWSYAIPTPSAARYASPEPVEKPLGWEAALLSSSEQLVFVMVGLPARGKSFIGRKIHRYISWLGMKVKIFNVGEYRRAQVGAGVEHGFFDYNNPDGLSQRHALAQEALNDLAAFLSGTEGGQCAVFDATNTTRARRALVLERVQQMGAHVIFVESVCDDEGLIEQNIRQTKLKSPDYAGWDAEAAVADFRERIRHYEDVYEPLVGKDDDMCSYISLYNAGSKVTVNKVNSYIGSRVSFFLMALHLTPRKIYFSRHGESEYNVAGKIGGDSPITPRGRAYAKKLAEYMQGKVRTVWTSTLKRTIQTAEDVAAEERRTIGLLDEIDAGICDEMTYDDIAVYFPDVHCARNVNKLYFRYPSGESYIDLAMRLEPVLFELERVQEPILVVAHQAVLRVLLSFFMEREPEQMPYLPIPMHSVIEVTPGSFGNEISVVDMEPEPGTY